MKHIKKFETLNNRIIRVTDNKYNFLVMASDIHFTEEEKKSINEMFNEDYFFCTSYGDDIILRYEYKAKNFDEESSITIKKKPDDWFLVDIIISYNPWKSETYLCDELDSLLELLDRLNVKNPRIGLNI